MSAGPVIAGNWKMNLGPEETRSFFKGFQPSFSPGQRPELLIFPPALSLAAALEARPAEPRIEVGVQNVHWEGSGAFTGELSVSMARGAGATHALVGHSERRHLFGETDEEVGKKVAAVLEGGLTPVICVGETLDERRAGRLEAVILSQLEAFLLVLQAHPGARVLLAYEPVWAIGTGETATPPDASEAHGILRGRLASALGPDRARGIPVLYGGSVKPANAAELLAAPDVDGVLVGGASLDPGSFQAIAEAVPSLPPDGA
ncbi:MAG: triose-phosphate isomerase [Longimicrobiales bacterium]